MLWQLDKFRFDPATNVLLEDKGETLLEPKTSALLKFFLENPSRNITRDELLEMVWDGNIVSDGAINRVVVQLRRALGDDEKIKRFIVTVPKVGYRFVMKAQKAELSISQKPRNIGMRVAVILIVISTGVFSYLLMNSNTTLLVAQSEPAISPLLRLSEEQFDPAMAGDASQLVYAQKTDTGANLFWTKSAKSTPVIIGAKGGNVSSPTWAPGSRALAYQYIQGSVCAFHYIEFSDEQPTAQQTVYICPANSRSILAFNSDGSKLYFTEQADEYEPSQVFSLDLKSGTKSRISQPLAEGRGNHYIDINPRTGALLLLSDQTPGQTTAFAIEPKDNSFQRLHNWSFRVDSAVWGHPANSIIHPDQHPSYQLIETDYSTGKSRVLVSDSRRIKTPKRIANDQDYLFTSYLYNRDIWVDGQPELSVNSSVMDYLPTLSRNGSKMAFISKRTGKSELWLKDFQSSELKTIDIKRTGLVIVGLDWSFDDRSIVATTSAGLFVVNFTTPNTVKHFTSKLPAYAARWTKNNTIIYSVRENSRWILYEIDLQTGNTQQVHENWALFLAGDQFSVSANQSGVPFMNASEPLGLDCAPPLFGPHLAFLVRGNAFYCVSNQNRHNVLQYSPGKPVETIQNMVPEVKQFSISADHTAHTVLVSSESDIMRTGKSP